MKRKIDAFVRHRKEKSEKMNHVQKRNKTIGLFAPTVQEGL